MNRTNGNRRKSSSKSANEIAPLQLVEEAFHLLRSVSGTTFLLYLIGALPFACVLLYFWADMSRSSYANRDAGLAALGLALAFFWKCSWQARFCLGLWGVISPGLTIKKEKWQGFRYHAALWFMQAFSIPAILLSIVLVIPMGWIATVFQNSYVLCLTQNYDRLALRGLVSHCFRSAHYNWAQNHGVWITLLVCGFLGWLNIFAMCSLPLMLGKMLFGIESVFTITPSALRNSTFVFGTILITYLLLSPLIKAVFVLRCFYADARVTGADLLSRLAAVQATQSDLSAKRKRRSSTIASRITVGVIGLLWFASAGQVRAQAPSQDRQLSSAIEETMAAKKYQWKFSRKAVGEGSEVSWYNNQISNLAKAIEVRVKRLKEAIVSTAKRFFKWLLGRLPSGSPDLPKAVDPSFSKSLNSVLSLLLVVFVLGLVGWLTYFLVKHYRDASKTEVEVGADPIGDIDLESEDIVADLLAEDEWMQLAREQIANGDSRLAIRALFLATLAHLGERNLLKIQKYKSNRDYRYELELKARQEEGLRDAFAENTGVFERTWYGLHHAGDDIVARFLKNYQIISTTNQA